MIPEDIVSYKEFMAICYENGHTREWEIKIKYELYVAQMMEWHDKVDEKIRELKLNSYYFMIGKFN